MQLPLGDSLSNPVAVVVGDAPQVVEADGDNNTPAAAPAVAVPCGISGRIEAENDVDYYAFEAKQGERFTFELFARRLQSPLDSHLRIVNPDGGQLALNDDLRIGERGYADSRIEDWTAPADGKFALEVRDLHLRGGDAFVYFVEARRARPYFNLFLDTDKTQLTPGTCGVLFARVERKEGFEGEIQLQVDGLPPGVTATCGRILAGKGQDGCIVLQADASAARAAANITVTGTATAQTDGKQETLRAIAVPYQEIYQPGGGRGHWPAQVHTVCVGAPNDLRGMKLSTTEIALKPGESKRIEVQIQRAEGFKENVTLDVQFQHLGGIFGNSLPPGVSLDAKNSQTLLTGDKSDGYITLTAAADAQPVEKQVIAVMANIAINFVMKATYSGPPVTVTVTK
jgi:hypothetical protein